MAMQIKILGCSGGIAAGSRTTSLLVDHDILIDAGTGVGDLQVDELKAIRHIFITHSHLDHIAFLPLLIDTVFEQQGRDPILVYGIESTIKAIKKHIFNWQIWPDFTVLPRPDRPAIIFKILQPFSILSIDERHIQAIPVNHIVPCVGYCVSHGDNAVAFSGDTTSSDVFWDTLNGYPRLDVVIVDGSFSKQEHQLAHLAGHYTPERLAKDLLKFKHRPIIVISHLKPGDELAVFEEYKRELMGWAVERACQGNIFSFP